MRAQRYHYHRGDAALSNAERGSAAHGSARMTEDGTPRPPRALVPGTIAPRTSQLLRELAYGEESPRITFGEMARRLRHRSFGLLTLVFSVPCVLPMPPGIAGVCGMIIMIISVQMLMGLPAVALPPPLARRSMSRALLRRMMDGALPHVQRLERVCRPRLPVAHFRFGEAAIGLTLLVLGIIIALPIPIIGNIPPGIATSIIAVGMSERDGLVVLIGMAATLIAVAVTSAMAWAVIRSLLAML
jgi:hypothetical protein